MRRPLALLAVVAIVAAAAPAAARAARVYAYDETTRAVVSFDSSNPSVLLSSVPLTGVAGGVSIFGLDWRPATGKYVLLTSLAGQAALFDFDPATGEASAPRVLAPAQGDPY